MIVHLLSIFPDFFLSFQVPEAGQSSLIHSKLSRLFSTASVDIRASTSRTDSLAIGCLIIIAIGYMNAHCSVLFRPIVPSRAQ